jgi:LPS O-antigen subunit length determinant protein (WzzB/FepE family)
MVQGFQPVGSGRQFSDEMTSQDGGLGMSENEKDNTHEKDEKDLQDQQPVQHIQVAPYGWYSQDEDEIDLADLFGVLYRRRKFIAATTILFVFLAFGLAKVMPKKFEAETMVEIGQVPIDGKYVKVENSDAVANRISSLAKLTALEMSKETETLGFSIKEDLEVDVPKEGNVATIGLTIAEDATDKGLDFLSRVNEKLKQEYTHFFEQYKNQIRAEIASKKVEISTVNSTISNLTEKLAKVKDQYENRMDAQRKRIDELERTIQKAETRQEAIETELESLKTEKEKLTKKLEEIEAAYNNLLQPGGETGTSRNPSEKAFFSTEQIALLSQIRERLWEIIPERTRELQVEWQTMDERVLMMLEQKAQIEERLLALSSEMREEIEKIQNQILELGKTKEQLAISIEQDQNKLNNLITTNVYVNPRLSDKPVAPNVKLIVALGFIGGLFLAVFLAFMAEFWSKNKQKITG